MDKRGWALSIGAALALALISLLSNITTEAQMMGRADTFKAIRLTISKLLNTGTVWAGLAILAGWFVRRPAQAAIAGPISCLTALVAHYGLARLIGVFDPEIWGENAYWFGFAAILGAPLGLIGSLAHRDGILGLAARLVVPAGALLEPFVLGMFTQPPMMDGPARVSSIACGSMLVAGGVIGCALVLMPRRKSDGGSLADRSRLSVVTPH